jgi:hypothetical protein
MIHSHQSEKGQAIVFLAIAVIALLGFVAIAIDGGSAYSDRRQAQNASDASSLAGGGQAALSMETHDVTYKKFSCSNSYVNFSMDKAKTAAEARAMTNGFDVISELNEVNGVEVDCATNAGPGGREKYIDITTRISTVTQMHLAQILFDGELRNNVNAVTRVRPRTPVAFGNAVVALNQGCQGGTGGVRFNGTADTYITGGGIFSNGCVTSNGNTGISVQEEFDVACTGYPDDQHACNKNWSTPSPIGAVAGTVPLPPSSFDIPQPTNCGPNRTWNGSSQPIEPGTYDRLRVAADKTLVMKAGLYCITGEITLNGNASMSGFGVTIFGVGDRTDMTMNGSGSVNLVSPPARECAHCPPAIPGVLIYLSKNNTGNVLLAGGASSTFEGLIYVPSGSIDVTGNSSADMPISAQLVAQTVTFSGNVDVKLHFDDARNFSFPARIELFK